MITVFVDGACSGGLGGWAWWVDDSPLGHDSGHEGETTNNRMEIQAAIEAISADHEHEPLRIVSDSAYVVNCMLERWFDGWRANGWRSSKKRPVENRDLWEELLAVIQAHRAPIEWVHVRGHGRRSTDPPEYVAGNDKADRLAVAARIRLKELIS